MHSMISLPSAAGGADSGATLGAGVACPTGGSIVPFGELRIFVALVPDEHPSGVLTISDQLSFGGGNVSSDINGLCVRVEVLST